MVCLKRFIFLKTSVIIIIDMKRDQSSLLLIDCYDSSYDFIRIFRYLTMTNDTNFVFDLCHPSGTDVIFTFVPV